MVDLRYRQIHLDFHTSETIPGIGSRFCADEFADTLKAAHVNSVTCFSRCHHGMIYHDTKFPAKHPHLTCNLLAEQIQADLTTAMKARDQLTVSVLRMAIAGIKEARVSGDELRELSDDDVLAIIAKEAKRRDEAAAAFTEGGRTESAAKELAERDILARYLPAPMTEDELAALVDEAPVRDHEHRHLA